MINISNIIAKKNVGDWLDELPTVGGVPLIAMGGSVLALVAMLYATIGVIVLIQGL
jgi:hypothetical protein